MVFLRLLRPLDRVGELDFDYSLINSKTPGVHRVSIRGGASAWSFIPAICLSKLDRFGERIGYLYFMKFLNDSRR